jgi:death-on-curing family protein
MAAHARRLASLITPTYAKFINAQLVAPAVSQVVKPNELLSALARPVQVAHYELDRDASYLAATLLFGLMQGHPFLDGNKRTAFFITNEYLRLQGFPSLVDGREAWSIQDLAEPYISVARGQLDVAGLDLCFKRS